MLFRITLSSDVNEYYKDNAMDIQMSMTVEASSFNNAKLTAEALMVSLVFWPQMFEVVSIDKIDEPEVEEIAVERPAIWNRETNTVRFEEPVKKAPEIWCLDTGITICDPDGWDRKNYDISWYEPITREEFIRRAMMSTCYEWPNPLHDEIHPYYGDEIEDCGDDSACDEPRCPSYRKYY